MKSSKTEEYWIIGMFCGFLAAMLTLFLILPKDGFSEKEKRYLAKPPQFSWDNLVSGDLGSSIESYMADHLPGRDFFVGLNAYFELWTGRQWGKDIYRLPEGRLVEAPAQWDGPHAEKNMRVLNEFAEKLGRPVDLILVPSAGWAALEDNGLYRDGEILENIRSMAGENLRPLDLLELYRDRPELYFKTDHHWNSRGAYECYRAYSLARERTPRPEEAFGIGVYGTVRGSTYSRSALWLTPAEPLELWVGSDDLTVTNGESDRVHDGVFYWERLEEADKYTVNLDGNHSIVRIENPNGAGKLLVIRDSYSNSLGTFLAENYETVVLVDLRYYKNAVSQLAAQENFDDILVCYSIGNFMTDPNLIWLR